MPLLFEIEEEQTVSTPQIEVNNGDLWQLAEHRLLCGDCTVKENIDLLMNGNKADMVFTDPPYNVYYSSKNQFLNSIDNRIEAKIINDNLYKEKNPRTFVQCFYQIHQFLILIQNS